MLSFLLRSCRRDSLSLGPRLEMRGMQVRTSLCRWPLRYHLMFQLEKVNVGGQHHKECGLSLWDLYDTVEAISWPAPVSGTT